MLTTLALVLAGAPAQQAPPQANWRTIATPADRARLRGWRASWMTALARIRGAGKGAEITRAAGLFDPDVALPRPVPPAGRYRCRTIKLGAKSESLLEYVAYPPFACQFDGLRFVKSGGSQRMEGSIYRDGAARAVFLGTLVLGDERRAIRYGRDAQRNIAGFVERIGPRRWRLVLPAPAFESLLDIVEITPR